MEEFSKQSSNSFFTSQRNQIIYQDQNNTAKTLHQKEEHAPFRLRNKNLGDFPLSNSPTLQISDSIVEDDDLQLALDVGQHIVQSQFSSSLKRKLNTGVYPTAISNLNDELQALQACSRKRSKSGHEPLKSMLSQLPDPADLLQQAEVLRLTANLQTALINNSQQQQCIQQLKDELFAALSKQHNRSTSPMCPDMSLPTSSNQHLPHNPPMKSNLSKKESTSTSPPEVRKLTQAKGCPNDKESMEEFVEMFKQRRDELGFSQGDVGRALGKLHGCNLSQSTISRFEAMRVSIKNMYKLKPLLVRWLQEAEQGSTISKASDRELRPNTNSCPMVTIANLDFKEEEASSGAFQNA